MASTDVELEQQLKEVGMQLSHPPDSVDELLRLLDEVEKLLSKVDQFPKKSVLDALEPSMKVLIQDSLSRHSDIDVKIAVASCISDIMRITAPDTPYNDDHLRDVFQLIVSSFEDLADQSSRSYRKRASILEIVSNVRLCVIMLDLECYGLIVEMFEHFLKSIRDYHVDSIYASMENIMILVLEEVEDISAELLKPLLVSVKKHNEGVLPIARKLGEGVILKSAAKLKPYLMPALISLGDTLDNYSQVVALVCEGTTATFEQNDENASVAQLVVKEGPPLEEVDATVDKFLKPVMNNGVNVTGNKEASVDLELSKKPEEDQEHPNLTSKEVISVTSGSKSPKQSGKKVGAGDSEAKKPKQSGKKFNSESDAKKSKLTSKKVDAIDAEGKTSKQSVKKGKDSISDIEPLVIRKVERSWVETKRKQSSKIIKSELDVKKSKLTVKKVNAKNAEGKTPKQSAEPSDSSHVEGEKEVEKLPDSERGGSKDVHSSPIKESSNDAVIPSEVENDSDAQVSSPKAIESKSVDVSSPSQSGSLADDSCVKKGVRSKKTMVAQQDEIEAANAASPSKSGSPADESRLKKGGRSKNMGSTQEDATSGEGGSTKETEVTSDVDVKPQRRAGKKAVAKEVKLPSIIDEPEDGEATSDSDVKPLRKSSKKAVAKEVKLPSIIDEPEDGEATSDSDVKPLRKSSKKADAVTSGSKSLKESGKNAGAGDSEAKKPKQSGKKIESESDVKKSKQTVKKVDAMDAEGKTSKQSVKKGEDSDDSGSKPLKFTVIKKRKKSGVETKPRKLTVDEEDDSDSDAKPLKVFNKKGKAGNSGHAKSSSKKKKGGRKRGIGKNVSKKDQAKSVFSDDEMDTSPKPATKSAKGEGNSKETLANSSKRKRTTVKDKVSDTMKYDESLVGLKVKIFWPADNMYYVGVIESFDSAEKKHKVLYVDGEVEILNLKWENWEILQELSVGDEDQTTKGQSEKFSAETVNQDLEHVNKEPVVTRNNAALSLLDIISSSGLNDLKFSSKKIGAGGEHTSVGGEKGSSNTKAAIVAVSPVSNLVPAADVVPPKKKRKQTKDNTVEAPKETESASRTQLQAVKIWEPTKIRWQGKKKSKGNDKGKEKITDVGGASSNPKRIPSEEEKNNDVNFTPCWNMLKDAMHTLSAGEREKLKKLKSNELSLGLDHTMAEMFGYTMEARERWAFLCGELKEKTKEWEKVCELEKELASCKAVMEQRMRESDYFEDIVKLKVQEVKRLSQQCVDAEKKTEEKVAEVEKKASEKIKTVEEKHQALVDELSRLKLEKKLLEEEKEKNWRERVWSLKDGLPFFVKLLHDCPEYLKGMAMVQKAAMAMGQAEASKVWKEAFVNGSLNEEMMRVEGNEEEMFLQSYADFNEMEWPFIQKIVAHAEASLDELKSLRPDGM